MKMKKLNILSGVIAFLIVLALVANASAITGRLANSRMVLHLDQGESVEKYLGVENVNDVPITIKLVPVGELADSIELQEGEFVLQPGESKKAYFTITANKPGTTETKINVFFTPSEGNGIALPATIVVVSSGENSDTVDNSKNDTNATDNSGFTFNPTNGANQNNSSEGIFSKISPMMLLLALSLLLIIVFIILIIYASKRNRKKRAGRSRA
jgi:hypothetical protein